MGTIKSKIFTSYTTEATQMSYEPSRPLGDVISKTKNSNLSSSIQQHNTNHNYNSKQSEQLARSTSAHLASETSKVRQHHHHSIKNESTGFTITNTCSTKKQIATAKTTTNCPDVDFNCSTNKPNNTKENNCNTSNADSTTTSTKNNIDSSDKGEEEKMNVLLNNSYGTSKNMDREKANKRYSLNIDGFNLMLSQQCNGNNYAESCNKAQEETSVEFLVVMSDEAVACGAVPKLPKLVEHDVPIDCYFDEPELNKVNTAQQKASIVTSFQPPTVLQKSQYFRSFRSASRRFFGGQANNLKRSAIVNSQSAAQAVSSPSKKLGDENLLPCSIANRRTFKDEASSSSNKFDEHTGKNTPHY
jgi:hypothetical protein